MKNLIDYYYNLNIYNLRAYEKNYLFNSNNNLYLLYKVNKTDDINYMKYILDNYKNIYMHIPILNKEADLLTFDGNYYWILFLINIKNNRVVLFKDILFFLNNNISVQNIKLNWIDLWKKKVDFLEYYIEKKDSINKKIMPLCYYYIGMAENAITYLENLKINMNINYDFTICHKRVAANYTLIELYNPINFIVDYKIRDICE